jgi:hypothetical protein
MPRQQPFAAARAAHAAKPELNGIDVFVTWSMRRPYNIGAAGMVNPGENRKLR